MCFVLTVSAFGLVIEGWVRVGEWARRVEAGYRWM